METGTCSDLPDWGCIFYKGKSKHDLHKIRSNSWLLIFPHFFFRNEMLLYKTVFTRDIRQKQFNFHGWVCCIRATDGESEDAGKTTVLKMSRPSLICRFQWFSIFAIKRFV